MSCYEWSVQWFTKNRHVLWTDYVTAARNHGWTDHDICGAYTKLGNNVSHFKKGQRRHARHWVKERMT
jgi:hypothetical protein